MRKRRKRNDKVSLPKGAYRVPGGGIADGRSTMVSVGNRRIRVTGIYKDPINLKQLAEALIEIARGLTDDELGTLTERARHRKDS